MSAAEIPGDFDALADGFALYQRDRNLARPTVKRRLTTVSSFAAYMAPRSPAEATVDDVERWLRTFPDAQTRYSYRSDVKMFYRWAVRRRLVASNPVDDTDPPRLPRRLPRPIRLEGIGLALTLADGEVQLMICLGFLAGLRVSEIAALHASDVFSDRTPPILIVRQGKGGKDRVVPLHPVLRDRLAHLPAGFLFPSRYGGHIRGATVSTRIATVFARAGIDATPHALRHTFGTELATEAAGNLVAVARVMGHSSTETTLGYVGWSPDAADAVARIGTR